MTAAETHIEASDSAAFARIVQARRSIRAFLPEPVAPEILEAVFAEAARAPSNCNTQPWAVHVASGAAIEALRQRLPADFMAGKMRMDFPYDGKYEGVYRERQHAAARALYDAMGIAREDKAGRHDAFMRNLTFFDAPHVAFLFLPEPFGLREACDLGMFAQTLMLGMTARGLGSCPQTALSFQVDQVREILGVDPSLKLLFGISFGYPDPAAGANACVTERMPLGNLVSFHQAPSA
ncbi:MAG: nitroreductase [Haliea sp.]|nr:nitroreductase [Haliea sp.]|tara:strand:+ start:123183 stop:123893 length:711 start_codon:yes stop_codon:yes gene_type:complete